MTAIWPRNQNAPNTNLVVTWSHFKNVTTSAYGPPYNLMEISVRYFERATTLTNLQIVLPDTNLTADYPGTWKLFLNRGKITHPFIPTSFYDSNAPPNFRQNSTLIPYVPMWSAVLFGDIIGISSYNYQTPIAMGMIFGSSPGHAPRQTVVRIPGDIKIANDTDLIFMVYWDSVTPDGNASLPVMISWEQIN